MKQCILLAASLAITGCSSMGVEAWDRDILAKEEMQLTSDPVEAALDLQLEGALPKLSAETRLSEDPVPTASSGQGATT